MSDAEPQNTSLPTSGRFLVRRFTFPGVRKPRVRPGPDDSTDWRELLPTEWDHRALWAGEHSECRSRLFLATSGHSSVPELFRSELGERLRPRSRSALVGGRLA